MELQSKGHNQHWKIFLHNVNDLADAHLIHPSVKFESNIESSEYTLKSKHFSKASTKSKPCAKYQPESCKHSKLQLKIQKTYKCWIQIFSLGQVNSTLPVCNVSVIEQMLEMSKKSWDCSKSVPCQHTDHSIEAKYVDYHQLTHIDSNDDKVFRLAYRQRL